MSEAPAPSPTPTPTPTPTPSPSPTPTAWTEGFDTDNLGYVQNKQWSGPGDLLKSYRDLEKLTGAPPDQIVRLPKADDVEGWKGVYRRLGAPETPDKYEIPMPAEHGDENYAKWARETFHGLNVPASMARKMVEAHNEYIAKEMKAKADAYKASTDADLEALKGEWKTDFDGNVALAKRAAAALGIDTETFDKLESAMGLAKLVKFTHGLGTKLGTDDNFVSGEGNNPGGGTSAAAAQSRMKELRADPDFVRRFGNGDAEARAEMKRLHQIAYPGDTVI